MMAGQPHTREIEVMLRFHVAKFAKKSISSLIVYIKRQNDTIFQNLTANNMAIVVLFCKFTCRI